MRDFKILPNYHHQRDLGPWRNAQCLIYKEVLNCTPCTFNNSSLKVLGVADHMSAHCRAGFSVAFIGSVHDVKFSYWFQMLECYIKMYNQNGCDCICLSSYTPYYALNLQKKEVAVAIFAKLKLCRHRRPATHTSCSEKLIESGQLIKGLMDWLQIMTAKPVRLNGTTVE